MRGAVIGAMLFEGWADTPQRAAEMADGGEVEFAPCHHFHAVGPHGRNPVAFHACCDRREHQQGEPGLRHIERGTRQGAAVRSLRPIGPGASELDGWDLRAEL